MSLNPPVARQPGDDIQTTEYDLLATIGREVIFKEANQKRYIAALQAWQILRVDFEDYKTRNPETTPEVVIVEGTETPA